MNAVVEIRDVEFEFYSLQQLERLLQKRLEGKVREIATIVIQKNMRRYLRRQDFKRKVARES